MKITITSGKGTGETLLSAFDAALFDCGVSNYNLLYLSSIIPPQTTIVTEKYKTPEEEYGNRLYVVKAEKRSSVQGEWLGAAVGWYQRADNGGVFVEHSATGNSEKQVREILQSDINRSLTDLSRLRKFTFEQKDFHIQMEVAQVLAHPTCVISMAIYKAESW